MKDGGATIHSPSLLTPSTSSLSLTYAVLLCSFSHTCMYLLSPPSPVSPIYSHVAIRTSSLYSSTPSLLLPPSLSPTLFTHKHTHTHSFLLLPSSPPSFLYPLPLPPSHLCTYLLGTAGMDDSNEGSGMGRQTGEGKEKQFQVARPVQGMDRIMTQCHTP